jgi:predicted extracellular nuclease
MSTRITLAAVTVLSAYALFAAPCEGAPLPGDVEPDATVDFVDFTVLAAAWLSTPADQRWNPACDMAGPADGIVDELDMAVLAGNWLETTRNLFFSEYVEGSGYNKALEIYNASGDPVNLADCVVKTYHNGNTKAGHTILLDAAELAQTEVFVLCHPDIDDPLSCDQLASGLLFNGDDAVELVFGGATHDVIGQIGFDPGSSWGQGEVTTQDHTLRRRCEIAEGDSDGSDEFDPAVQWQSYPVDTFDGLGSHCQ